MMIQFFCPFDSMTRCFYLFILQSCYGLLKYEYTDALHYTSTRDACYKSTMYFYIHYIHMYNMHTHTPLTCHNI